jgi:ferredoxin
MKVEIERSKCQGHAQCELMSDGFYELDDLGFIATADGEVPAESEEAAQFGAGACPERVIAIRP